MRFEKDENSVAVVAACLQGKPRYCCVMSCYFINQPVIKCRLECKLIKDPVHIFPKLFCKRYCKSDRSLISGFQKYI